jgi:hypothetical protein
MSDLQRRDFLKGGGVRGRYDRGSTPRTAAQWRVQRRAGVASRFHQSQWIPGNPPDVLATIFGKRVALYKKFPRNDVFISSKSGP